MARTCQSYGCFVVTFWVVAALIIINRFAVSPCASCPHLVSLIDASESNENVTRAERSPLVDNAYESETATSFVAKTSYEQGEEVKQLNLNEPSNDPIESTNGQQQSTTSLSMFQVDDDDQTKLVKAFRVEYSKYRILSQLGITVDPTDFRDTIDPQLKSQLISMELDNEARLSRGKNQRSDRHNRALSCNHVKAEKNVCCLERLFINFTEIGWDKWILHPDGYNANFCRGGCDLSHLRYYHTTLMSKISPKIEVCCSPSSTLPLTMLYLDDQKRVQRKILPDMIADSCDCA